MLNLILAILAILVIGLSVYGFSKNKGWVVGIIAGALIFTLAFSFTVIPTGHTGVKTTFGQISAETLQSGFNFKIPFIQSIQTVNNKQQDVRFKDRVWSVTAENTNVFFEDVVVTYQINTEKSAWIYANVANYEKNLVSSVLVQSALKAGSVTLTTDEVPNRGLLEPTTKEYLQEALDEKYSSGTVLVTAVNIGNVDFEEGYNQALEQKQLAQKQMETAQIQNNTAVAKAQADAEVKLKEAQAEAESKLIKANAEAEANRVLTEKLTPEILANKYIEKWNGAHPLVTDGDGMILDVSSLLK